MIGLCREQTEIVLDRRQLERILRDRRKLGRQGAKQCLPPKKCAGLVGPFGYQQERSEVIGETSDLPSRSWQRIGLFDRGSQQGERGTKRRFRFRGAADRSLQNGEVIPKSSQARPEFWFVAELFRKPLLGFDRSTIRRKVLGTGRPAVRQESPELIPAVGQRRRVFTTRARHLGDLFAQPDRLSQLGFAFLESIGVLEQNPQNEERVAPDHVGSRRLPDLL